MTMVNHSNAEPLEKGKLNLRQPKQRIKSQQDMDE